MTGTTLPPTIDKDLDAARSRLGSLMGHMLDGMFALDNLRAALDNRPPES